MCWFLFRQRIRSHFFHHLNFFCFFEFYAERKDAFVFVCSKSSFDNVGLSLGLILVERVLFFKIMAIYEGVELLLVKLKDVRAESELDEFNNSPS